MFNLEQAIAEWRQKMLATGIETPVPLEELEVHLREDMERQVKAGLSEQEAFANAVQLIGQASSLKREFGRAGGIAGQVRQSFPTFAGISSYCFTAALETLRPSIYIESTRQTYLKTCAFLFPTLMIWMFSFKFLFPPIQGISKDFERALHNDGVGTILLAGTTVISFLGGHEIHFVCAAILAIILLEWHSIQWPRYRRTVVRTGALFLNYGVMALIALMVYMALALFLHTTKQPPAPGPNKVAMTSPISKAAIVQESSSQMTSAGLTPSQTDPAPSTSTRNDAGIQPGFGPQNIVPTVAADPQADLKTVILDIARLIRTGNQDAFKENYAPPGTLDPQQIEQLQLRNRHSEALAAQNPDYAHALQLMNEAFAQSYEALANQTPTLNAAGDEATYMVTMPSTSDMTNGVFTGTGTPSPMVFVKVNGQWYIKSGSGN